MLTRGAWQVNDVLKKIEAVIRLYTNRHMRRTGDPREKEIPTNRKGTKAKIPLAMVDPEWLAMHPDSNTPLRIEGYVEQPRARTEEEEDDMYGDMPAEDDGEYWRREEDSWPIDPELDEEGVYH